MPRVARLALTRPRRPGNARIRDMATISELVASGSPAPAQYGIVVDVDDVTAPEGLREAGLLARLEGGELADDVLDIAISWTLAGIDVTVEVPATEDCGEPKRLLSTVAAVGVHLSLLPPEDQSDEAFEAYTARVEGFTAAYARQANMGKFLAPVTSYLGYMFTEVLNPEAAANFQPTDDYVIESFHSKVPTERADALKARIRAAFHEAYGGEEGFATMARSLGATIYRKVEESCAEESARQASFPKGGDPAAEEPGTPDPR
jgi:hypothetical protein